MSPGSTARGPTSVPAEPLDPLGRAVAALARGEAPVSFQALQAAAGLAADELSRVVVQLESAGWIARQAPPAAGGPDSWSLTPLGRDEVARRGLLTDPVLARDPGGHVVIRPGRHALRYWFAGTLATGGGLFVAAVVRGLLELSAWTVGIVVAAALVLVPGAYLAARWTTAARLTSTDLVVRTWYGRMRRVRRGSIAAVVLATVWMPRNPRQWMLFVDGRGRCLARATTYAIEQSSQEAFARQVGVPVVTGGWTFRQLRAQFPGSAPWAYAHPRTAGLFLGLGITVAVILAVALHG